MAPFRAAAEGAAGLRVLAAPGWLAFAFLGTVALHAGWIALLRRAIDARSAGLYATVATAALLTLVLIGTRRRERMAG